MTRRGTLRLVACLLAGAAVVSGCSEEQEAGRSLPSASSAAPTQDELPPLGPEDMPMPAEARTQDAAGAEAFVDYYLGLAEFVAETSLDPQPLLELSLECVTCQEIAASYTADKAAGYSYADYSYIYTPYDPVVVNDDTAGLGFSYEQSDVRVTDVTGTLIADRSAPASGPLESGAKLTWDEVKATWLMSSLTVG